MCSKSLFQPNISMIPNLPGSRVPEQQQVEVAQRKQQPSKGAVSRGSQGAPRQPEFHVFEQHDEQRRGGSGAPAFAHDLEITGKLAETVGRVAPEITRIFVKSMAERDHDMRVAAWGQHALNFLHDGCGVLDVFENRIALHSLEEAVGKREAFRIGGDIDPG